MNNKLSKVSMIGRMAYTIMCVEEFLTNQYPNKDWTLVSSAMWKATSTNWGDWPEYYALFIPSVLFEYDSYCDEIAESITKTEYNHLIDTYCDITQGLEDDPDDEITYMLNLPFEMAMVYEGTTIGDGAESFDIISNAEAILKKHNIPLPDYDKVLFSSTDEFDGWGKAFDGRYLSIILN